MHRETGDVKLTSSYCVQRPMVMGCSNAKPLLQAIYTDRPDLAQSDMVFDTRSVNPVHWKQVRYRLIVKGFSHIGHRKPLCTQSKSLSYGIRAPRYDRRALLLLQEQYQLGYFSSVICHRKVLFCAPLRVNNEMIH
jgi:hypothetical protein